MATKTRWNFRAKEWSDSIYKTVANEQTTKLVEYAEKEIVTIADTLNNDSIWSLDNGRYSKGNLLDSLCWGVCFKGTMRRRGYYRDKKATDVSYLHEFTQSRKTAVDGHFLAVQFLKTYEPTIKDGWEVVFGCLAPYQAYWEAGHFNIIYGLPIQFQAMTQRYDVIKNELSPLCKVDIIITVPN